MCLKLFPTMLRAKCLFPNVCNFPHSNQLYPFTKWPKEGFNMSCVPVEADSEPGFKCPVLWQAQEITVREWGCDSKGKQPEQAVSLSQLLMWLGNDLEHSCRVILQRPGVRHHQPLVESCWGWGQHWLISWHFPDHRPSCLLMLQRKPSDKLQ